MGTMDKTRFLFSFLLLFPIAFPMSSCPAPGPILPPPRLAISKAPESLIPEFISFPNYFDFDEDSSYFIRAKVGSSEIYRHSHIAEPYAVAEQDPDNIKFCIASITKLFTVLAVILSKDKISWEGCIKEYVPELQGEVWNDVTIGALAAHTSGLGKFGYVGDLASTPGFKPALLGITPANLTAPDCDIGPGPDARHCTYAEVIEMFNNPVELPRSPNSGPLYSNIGFNLLGLALKKVHSASYEQIIQELILEPLGLTNTSFVTPAAEDHNALLPLPSDNWITGDFGNFNPTGGLWSTAHNLMRFLRAILDHEILSPAETRKWLEPHSLLPSLHQLVGAPWEIYRPDGLNVTYKRPIDIYTKAGGIDGYAGYAIIVPEYDLAVTINAAGNSSAQAVKTIMPLVMRALISYVDKAVRSEAQHVYEGTYSTQDGKSYMNIVLDAGPGLSIDTWFMNDVPIPTAVSALLHGNAPIPIANTRNSSPAPVLSARLYPTDPDSWHAEKQFWRIHFSGPEEKGGFADMACMTWAQLDRFRYAQQPLDAAYFVLGEEGRAVAVELPGWGSRLERIWQ